MGGDFAAQMVSGISRFLDAELERAVERRPSLWKYDYSSVAAYQKSVEPNRGRLAAIIGLSERVPKVELRFDAAYGRPSLVATTPAYEIHTVRWPVYADMEAEGLLFEPSGTAKAAVIALPEADWSPEQLAGLTPDFPAASQYARRLAEQDCRVLVPVLIDRKDTWSGNPRFRYTNQPHREFIYRMAYQLGRHIIGYEVEKVRAAVDWIKAGTPALRVGVAGYGEGGLIALYSAAVDRRIDAALVSGYFESREGLWQEPIYRNVWSLLAEFGDAQLAALIAPRSLFIEAVPGPSLSGPPAPSQQRRGAAPGKLKGPDVADVKREFAKAAETYKKLGVKDGIALVTPAAPSPGSTEALTRLLASLRLSWVDAEASRPFDSRKDYDPNERLQRQFNQMVEHTQRLLRSAEVARGKFWAKADLASVDGWKRTSRWYRDYYWKEVIGKLPAPSEPVQPQVREVPGTDKWKRYDVVLPVWPDVFAYGVLLLPNDLGPSERRPVVVCQHGLEGRPDDVILPENKRTAEVYGNFAAKLADRGFVVFAPQAPYIGDFRHLQRKANPLKLSMYSFILGQNQRILEWLSQQPFVDAGRIGFYGLSYGGKTAVRVPPLLEQYALSICSGDFNEWIWKVATMDFTGSYMFTQEWEIPEFDTGNTFNHGELAMLMASRPFMVERGHRDGVGIDEQVSYEYSKVRRFYDELGIGERTTIEYFNGPHQIHGVGTFEFLHRFLKWPEPR